MNLKRAGKIKNSYWLVKFAPFRTSWNEVIRRGIFTLRGVRSPEARNNLKAMRMRDLVLFYHSQQERAVVGIMEVSRCAYSDPTSVDPQWLTCDFRPVKTLRSPVSRTQIKSDPELADISLIHQPRLSVMPLSQTNYDRIISYANSPKTELCKSCSIMNNGTLT